MYTLNRCEGMMHSFGVNIKTMIQMWYRKPNKMEKIMENHNSLITDVCENSDGIIDLYKVVWVL